VFPEQATHSTSSERTSGIGSFPQVSGAQPVGPLLPRRGDPWRGLGITLRSLMGDATKVNHGIGRFDRVKTRSRFVRSTSAKMLENSRGGSPDSFVDSPVFSRILSIERVIGDSSTSITQSSEALRRNRTRNTKESGDQYEGIGIRCEGIGIRCEGIGRV
jgi:hypothetical protein